MHLVFDLDGVLLDSEADLGWLHSALDRTLVAIGRPTTPENRAKLMPGRLRELPQVAEDWSLPAGELWRIRHERYLDAKLSSIRSREIRPFPDVGTLDAFDDTPLHIISNSPQSVVEAFIDVYGLTDRFQVRLGRGEGLSWLDRIKPARYFYDRLTAMVGSNQQFLYVGDTATDRSFATNTGMQYFHVDRTAGRGLHRLTDEVV